MYNNNFKYNFADVIKFYAIERVAKCVEQLAEGLRIMSVLENMQKRAYFLEVMCNINTVLDVTTFEPLFEIKLSEEGSNKRTA